MKMDEIFKDWKALFPLSKEHTELLREEMQCEIDIVKNSEKDTWWYDGQRIVFRSENGERLLGLMKNKPIVSFSEMAEYLSVNRSAVQKQVEGFRKKGYVDRRDDGSWHVLALNSRITGK